MVRTLAGEGRGEGPEELPTELDCEGREEDVERAERELEEWIRSSVP